LKILHTAPLVKIASYLIHHLAKKPIGIEKGKISNLKIFLTGKKNFSKK